jgi:hypothetical protein
MVPCVSHRGIELLLLLGGNFAFGGLLQESGDTLHQKGRQPEGIDKKYKTFFFKKKRETNPVIVQVPLD